MLNHVSQEFKVVNVADKIEAVHLGEAHKNVLGEEKKKKDTISPRKSDHQKKNILQLGLLTEWSLFH